jgi:hypothetical protein
MFLLIVQLSSLLHSSIYAMNICLDTLSYIKPKNPTFCNIDIALSCSDVLSEHMHHPIREGGSILKLKQHNDLKFRNAINLEILKIRPG